MPHLLTKEGLQALQEELTNIRDVLLPQVIASIEAARAQGDLRENADYEISLAKKLELEARLAEIEEILNDYQIIDSQDTQHKVVKVGSSVKVQYLDTNKIFELKIVGASEANVLNFRISNESPLARAILGKSVGAEVKVNIRLNDVAKTRQTKIVKILDIA
jgi:Transcription elongation factor